MAMPEIAVEKKNPNEYLKIWAALKLEPVLGKKRDMLN